MATKANQVVPMSRGEHPLDKLRQPFPPNQISKLPKESRKQIDERKNRVPGCMVWQCPECGNAHHKDAVHLDYVGHAAATDRLLDTDPAWSWEPLSVNEKGLPAFDENGGLWIKLTVCGVTRLGYGSADGKTGGDAKKEIIGDAIRNAGMRFGMALDLWHKGDLHIDDDHEVAPQERQETRPRQQIDETTQKMIAGINAATTLKGLYEWKALNGDLVNTSADKKRIVALFNDREAALSKKEQGGAASDILDDSVPY